MSHSFESLLEAARRATENAYAPYSNFRVGAAVLLEDGRIFTGGNVENSSYGLTNCAERSAIFNAIANTAGGKIRVHAVAVDNAAQAHCSPCGACRQVIAEFGTPETEIHYRGANGMVTLTLAELLPDGFRL
jgi:homotetrameric cytidine deaminase